MGNPFENPFLPQKRRKPGVAGLVGDMFGEKAKAALEKKIGKEKPKPLAPVEENWGDIVLSAQDRMEMRQRRDVVILQSIPTFQTLPGEKTFKKKYALDDVWANDFREDAPVYALRDGDLKAAGLDAAMRSRILEGMKAGKESTVKAKIFCLADVIEQKKNEDPNHADFLNTKEVFEAIENDECRPATLQELLVYCRDYWRTDVDSRDLSDEERILLKGADAQNVIALGSVVTYAGRFFPRLSRERKKRILRTDGLTQQWTSTYAFLVALKNVQG